VTNQPKIDPKLHPRLNDLAEIAKRAGAEGIWLIRGATDAHLLYTPIGQPGSHGIPGLDKVSTSLTIRLDLADAGVLVVMRFPASDGGEPGIESR